MPDRFLGGDALRPLATLLFVLIIATVFSPRPGGTPLFWQPENLSNMLRQISDIGILAVGMTIVIVGGGIDLSMGSLLALSCTLFAHVYSTQAEWWSPYAAALLAIGICGGIGVLSGSVIAYLRLQPFIVTLAAMIGSRGLARWWVDNTTIAVGYDERTRPLIEFVGRKAFVVPAFLAVAVVGFVLLRFTRFGRYIAAVGGSEETARLSGLPVAWVKVRAYGLSGLIAGLAGVLYCCETHQGDPKAGTAYELDAIAAAVIGGTRLTGGRGGIPGTLVGALVLGIVSNVLGLNNVDENVQWMLKAVIIVAAVWLQRLGSRERA